MATLNIHYETFDEKSFSKLKELSTLGKIAVSIAPRQLEKISNDQLLWLRDNFLKGKLILGQQGLDHSCKKCEKFHLSPENNNLGIDKWHENYCLWFGEISESEQKALMTEGRNLLQRFFGVKPMLYVPPNHLLGKNTLHTAEHLGYSWITDRALFPEIKPYKIGRLIIIPEGEPEIGNKNIYIHADRWRGDLENSISEGVEPFDAISSEKVSDELILQNKHKKIVGKIARDLHKGYGLTGDAAKACAEMIYESKFSMDGPY